jgi:lipoate-protein ligase A
VPNEEPSAAAWHVERRHGSAEALHHLEPPARRTVWELVVDAPALVLGSAQDAATVDVEAAHRRGVAVTRRRSGGGAVLLVPGEHVWIDLVVPAGDPLWVDDVEAATWWLGAAWVEALAAAGVDRERMAPHGRGVTDRGLGSVVCFAATGPGEVLVDGRKLVGISQRRTRDAARFQCVVHRHFDAGATLDLVDDRVRSSELRATLASQVADLGEVGVEPGWSVVEGLVGHLP